MTTGILLLAGLAAAALIGWFAAEFVNRRPFVGALAVFIWLAVMVVFIDRPEFFVRGVGGINVAVPDLLCAFLGGVAGLRFLRGFPLVAPGLRLPLLVFTLMLLFSYGRGVLAFGLQRSTNEFREFFYFLTALAFSLSFRFEKLGRTIPLAAVIGGLLLVVAALTRMAMMGGFKFEERPIPSYAALAIGQAFFLGWFWLQERPRAWFWRWIIFGFLPFCFLMLHRSVWVALLGGLVALIVLDHRRRMTLVKTMVVGAAVACVFVGIAFGEKILTSVNQAFAEATSSEGSTFIWRVEGWQALLRHESGWNIPELIAGRPMGSGYARVLGNSVVNLPEIESGVIPHNYYISLLLRGGLVGTFAFLLLYAKLLKTLVRRAREKTPVVWAGAFAVILVTQLIYYVPYSADIIQGLFLGAAASFAAAPLSLHETEIS